MHLHSSGSYLSLERPQLLAQCMQSWCVQALLEMQRQRDSTRLGSTRELPPRANSAALPTVESNSEAEVSRSAMLNGISRAQSKSFSGEASLT